MRVAICDDEPNDLISLESALKTYDRVNRLSISRFTSANALYRSTEHTAYDIAILDIEMSAPNGYEIAQRLCTQKPKPLIIFLTNSMAYTIRGYGVAFRYLTKPIAQPILADAMDSAIREITANRFVFSVEGVSHYLTMEEIYFFEVFNHHMVLHTMDREYAFRATLKDIVRQLPPGFFGLPHQSYIVNFTHIKTSTSKEIHLTNGVVVPISRRKLRDFEEQFNQYLGR